MTKQANKLYKGYESMEHVIYQDHGGNLISPSRAVIAGTTYPLQNISSVRMGSRPQPLWAVAVLVIFATFFAIGQVWAVVALFAIMALVVWLKTKPQWIVVISTSGQERAALTSPAREEIEAIVTALNQAIVSR